MKQVWYPSQLTPRTYFAWGGSAISSSAHLRSFFNDLADQFPPTHRHNRVQPNWLYDVSVPPGGFFFYDLTSFTSWFHEQTPFLEALARYFTGTGVFVVGPNLSLVWCDVGALIYDYIGRCNEFPPFIISKSTGGYGPDNDFLSLRHMCAGFLGVPGNLVTCTLPHGLAMASRFDNARQLQVPGDDVGGSFWSPLDLVDKKICASTLGVLQMDKVYDTSGIAVYLKRLVKNRGQSITLADMLIHPLLPFLTNNTSDTTAISSPYRLPNPDLIVKRACSVMVSFMRDLWNLTKGDLDSFEVETIHSFLIGIHDRLDIPYGAVWQSRLYCDERPRRSEALKGVTIKFPVDDQAYLMKDPDARFADRFVEVMHIHRIDNVRVTTDIEALAENQSIVVSKMRGWSFLEDMGYVRLGGIPGEVVTLIGPDAKTAFLHAQKPNLVEVTALCDIRIEQLIAVGIVNAEKDVSYFSSPREINGQILLDRRSDMSYRYDHWVDVDMAVSKGPKSVRSGYISDESDDDSVLGYPTEILDY